MGVWKGKRIVGLMLGLRAQLVRIRPLSVVILEETDSKLSPLQEQSFHLVQNTFQVLIFANSPSKWSGYRVWKFHY